MLRAIIADDEPAVGKLIRHFLKNSSTQNVIQYVEK